MMEELNTLYDNVSNINKLYVIEFVQSILHSDINLFNKVLNDMNKVCLRTFYNDMTIVSNYLNKTNNNLDKFLNDILDEHENDYSLLCMSIVMEQRFNKRVFLRLLCRAKTINQIYIDLIIEHDMILFEVYKPCIILNAIKEKSIDLFNKCLYKIILHGDLLDNVDKRLQIINFYYDEAFRYNDYKNRNMNVFLCYCLEQYGISNVIVKIIQEQELSIKELEFVIYRYIHNLNHRPVYDEVNKIFISPTEHIYDAHFCIVLNVLIDKIKEKKRNRTCIRIIIDYLFRTYYILDLFSIIFYLLMIKCGYDIKLTDDNMLIMARLTNKYGLNRMIKYVDVSMNNNASSIDVFINDIKKVL